MKITKRPALFLIIMLFICGSRPGWAIVDPSSEGAGSTVATSEAALAQWDEIKTLTFEQRDKYFSGLKKILEIVDAQADDVQAKRRLMSNRSETVDWDLAIKEFLTTRDYLRSLSREATKTTVKEWDHTKEKISQAWTQTQSAYDKARLSTPK